MQSAPISKMPCESRLRQGLKFRWTIHTAPNAAVMEIARTHCLTYPIAHCLYAREIREKDQISRLLTTDKDRDVAHSSLLKGALQSIARIKLAIERGEKILIFGDYDVDGITSSSIMLLALLPLKANVNFYLPNRKKDGYGLSVSAVERAVHNGYSLIITVDNGISAFAAAFRAQELKIDLIITDHHQPHDDVPPAFAIVNPQQKDCPFPAKSLAGVGVAFKLMCLLYEQLGKNLPEKVYELLTLGTVADVVALTGENRYWVQYGLSLINKHKSRAITQLLANSNFTKSQVGSRDIGFMVAPQLNALGRIDDPRDAVAFMISTHDDIIERVGKKLKEINDERKKIDRDIFLQMEEAIANKTIDLSKEHVIFAASKTWPAGVIGLVAGKLVQHYGRPTFLLHLTADGLAKGSCRSVPGLDLFGALKEHEDLLISFGGHTSAAGLALKQENLPELKSRLEATVARQFTLNDLQPNITIDAPLELPEITPALMADLDRLEPFGHKNHEPTFLIPDVTLVREPQLLKDAHVKASVFSQGTIKPIIFFNRPDIYQALSTIGDKPFDIVATVTRNEWNGKTTLELMGQDIAIG